MFRYWITASVDNVGGNWISITSALRSWHIQCIGQPNHNDPRNLISPKVALFCQKFVVWLVHITATGYNTAEHASGRRAHCYTQNSPFLPWLGAKDSFALTHGEMARLSWAGWVVPTEINRKSIPTTFKELWMLILLFIQNSGACNCQSHSDSECVYQYK